MWLYAAGTLAEYVEWLRDFYGVYAGSPDIPGTYGSLALLYVRKFFWEMPDRSLLLIAYGFAALCMIRVGQRAIGRGPKQLSSLENPVVVLVAQEMNGQDGAALGIQHHRHVLGGPGPGHPVVLGRVVGIDATVCNTA